MACASTVGVAEPEASVNLEWYAGYASIVAAEFFRREARAEEALAAYARAVAHYEAAVVKNPQSRDSADHYIALCLAGRGRVEFEHEDFENAVASVCAAFTKKPSAAASPDGLNLSPVDTAKTMRTRLTALEKKELAEKLDKALAALDPELLLPPAYEPRDPDGTRPGNRRGNRQPAPAGR